MQDIKLKVIKREISGKAVKSLRQNGTVPGVVYGQGKDATAIQLDDRTLEKAYHEAGTSRLIELEIEGEKEPRNVLFHEVQHDPVSHKILHFDLYSVRMDEKIRTEVPLYFEGEAPAVHTYGALLLKTLENVEIEALPKDLPEHIVVDLSGLAELDQSIHVKDLPVPSGVEILADAEEMVAKIEAAREEEEEEELPPEGAEAELVESEHGGKDETEDAEAEGEKAESKEE